MSAKTAPNSQGPIIHPLLTCENIRTSSVGGGKRTAGKGLRRAELSPEVIARFHTKYDAKSPADCWLWRGAITSAGYGSVGIVCREHHEVTRPAHRVAYVLAHGDIPSGLVVMHSCDNPPCVNPAHLSLGTHADNRRDSIAKGRRPRACRKVA